MSSHLPTIDDLPREAHRVLVRADLNVPLTDDGSGHLTIADDSRLRAALPTLEELRARGSAIVLASHLGRPHGREPRLSLRPVAERLRELTSAPVTLAPGVVGPAVRSLARQLAPGAILLLENVRFEPGETRNDPGLAAGLAELADAYVDDAFATAHRAHASNVGVAELLPSVAGRLLEHEVSVLTALMLDPDPPLIAVLGGMKVTDKLGVVHRFLQIADVLCIGGAMALAFLAAGGHSIGDSPCTEEDRAHAGTLLEAAAAARCRLVLPTDLTVAGPGLPADAPLVTDDLDVGDGRRALDIGPRTAAHFGELIEQAATVFWNGPLGRFELDGFTQGTSVVARAVSATPARTIVGGGETIQALARFGDPGQVTHVSTGGGAMLDMLTGRPLPAVQALRGLPAAA
jgi:phosphoglycerate kinase